MKLPTEYHEFMRLIFELRKEAAVVGFTDKSRMERYFLPFYEKVIGGDKVSVTEYGSGVPLLSLYLAAQGVIDKIFAVDNDESIVNELEAIVKETNLPVEIVNQDLNTMEQFPDTEVGMSLNCLYGCSPTFFQGASGVKMSLLPRITNPVVEKSNHQRFGLFRYMNNRMPWDEREEAVSDMERFFRIMEEYEMIQGYTGGFIKGQFGERPLTQVVWGVGSILGLERK